MLRRREGTIPSPTDPTASLRLGRLFREQPERVHMPRAHHAEVAVVERRELGFVEPLDDGENRRVDETDIGV